MGSGDKKYAHSIGPTYLSSIVFAAIITDYLSSAAWVSMPRRKDGEEVAR
jgi:hypothetical protein